MEKKRYVWCRTTRRIISISYLWTCRCRKWTATRQPDGFVQYEKKLKRKHLPIIALTANVFAEDSERALHAGMDAHMGKPVEVPQLLATMMHWIG